MHVASEGHRVNLIGNYTHYGLSIRENADGRKYYINIFVKKYFFCLVWF